MKRIFSMLLALVLLATAFVGMNDAALANSATGTDGHTHNWKDIGRTMQPTCTEYGYRTEMCTICQQDRQVPISPLGHYFPNPWVTITAPTCTEVGHEMNTCVRVNRGKPCGYEWWREIPALGHDWGEWHVIKVPTAEEDGIEERACQRCGITEQRPLHLEDYHGSAALSLAVGFDKDKVYKANETVTFTCTVTNIGGVPLQIERVILEFLGDDEEIHVGEVFKQLDPGKSTVVTVEYATTQEDEDKGFASAELVARGWELDQVDSEEFVVSNKVPVVINLDDFMDYELIVEKKVTSKPANGSYFTEGELIRYKVEVTNRFDAPLYNIKVEDFPDGITAKGFTLGTIEELPPYTAKSFETVYTVTGDDCARGYHLNLAYAQGDDTNGTTTEVNSPCGFEGLKVEKAEISVPANGAFYTEGETIVYRITVSNIGKTELHDVWVFDVPEDWEIGEALDSGITLAPGEQRQYDYSYTVTDWDCERGSMLNYASASWQDPDNPSAEKHTVSNTVESPCSKISELLITKTVTSTPSNGEYYVDGETITYLIEVWNLTDHPLYDLEVYDNRNDNEFARTLLGTVPVFDAHAYVKYNYDHTVDVDDIMNSPYPNSATAFWNSTDLAGSAVLAKPKNEEKSNVVECDCGEPQPGVRLSKYVKSTPANGMYYVEGETVRYYVVIQNNTDGHVYVSNFADTLSPIGDFFGDPYSWGDLYPGQISDAEYSYVITDLDVLLGSKENTASVTWADEQGNADTTWSNTVIVPTGKEKTLDEVTLEKRVLSVPENGAAYVVGEQITYEVTITNNYHTIVQDVEITDPLKGANEDSVIGHIETLHMHESYSYIYVYTVTQEDAEVGYVLNQATAIWNDGRTREQHSSFSNIVTVPVFQIVPPQRVHTYLAKYEDSTPANGLYYVEGETVRYGVYLVNDGDADVFDAIIHDDLYDPSWNWGSHLGTPGTVKAGESSPTFYFDHVVTAEEALLGHITNQAAAQYHLQGQAADEGEIITSNVVIVLTGIPEPEDEPVEFELHKTVVSTSANEGYYVKGETVAYLITLVNNSDLPLFIDQTWDQIWNAGLIWQGDLGTGTVNPHDSISFGYTHQVTQDDVDYGLLTNVVVMDFFTQKADDHIEFFTAMDSVEVICKEGPQPPEEPDYPVVIKYETSHPANWSYYTKDEVVEYDVWVYNFTGRNFSNIRGYDILLDTPGFYFGSMPTLDATPAKFHISYTVTDADVILESIYNIAWVTLYDDTYQNEFTIYSNEVVVPTKGTVYPPEKHKTVCDYQLLASGEGADEYMNVYCAEHAGVQAAAEKLLKQAATPEAKSNALEIAVGLWQSSLDRQYLRLFGPADEALKTALANDQTVFNAYLAAYRERLLAQGLDADSVNELLCDALCDRVCELCYTAGTAPETRKDVQHEGVKAIERQGANECRCALDRTNAAYFTKSVNVCNRHAPLLKAITRLFTAAGEDETLKAIAWDKAQAYWMAELNGEYEQMIQQADPEARHCLTVERASCIAAIAAHVSLYEAYYPQGAPIGELRARMVQQKALSLCR